jgi:hypothetical protein
VTPPSPDLLFAAASTLALVGWLALAVAPLAPRAAVLLAGHVLPLVLSAGYAALVLAFWAGADGGFGTLADVQALFVDPWIALAGWVHYLAFDLAIGAQVWRQGRDEGMAHLLLLPILALVFLFGPAGFLAFHTVRLARGGAIAA